MATIGGDRDKLLKAFLDGTRRKRKPGRVRTGTPQPGQGEDATFKRSSTPPIPGFGQFQQQYNSNSERSWKELRKKNPSLPLHPPSRSRRPRRPRLSGGGGPGKVTYN